METKRKYRKKREKMKKGEMGKKRKKTKKKESFGLKLVSFVKIKTLTGHGGRIGGLTDYSMIRGRKLMEG